MFEKFLTKKIELWLVLIILLLFFIGTILFGGLVRSYLIAGNRFGIVGEIAIFMSELPTKPAKVINNIFVSRYLSTQQKFKEFEKETFYFKKNERDDLGYILISRYDSKSDTNIVELLDLNLQEIIYKWYNNSHDTIDHPLLLNDGSLIAKDYSSGNLIKIDKCSKQKILNKNTFLHHSTELDADGNIWIPIRYHPNSETAKELGLDAVGFVDDGIAKLNLNGDLLYKKNILEILIENNLGDIIFTSPPSHDPIHLNDIQPALEDGKFWKKNDLFLSIKNQSMIILYRPSTNKILWFKKGPWSNQHDVDIIDKSKISVFDNNISDKFNISEFSNYVVYDFETESFEYPFSESFKKFKIATLTGGLSETINDKEILIEESDFGRLIIVDKNSKPIWRYHNLNDKGESFILSWSRYIKKGSIYKTLKILKNSNCIN